MLLGSWLQPAAALALPQQQLEDIRQAIEKDFSEGAGRRSILNCDSAECLPYSIIGSIKSSGCARLQGTLQGLNYN